MATLGFGGRRTVAVQAPGRGHVPVGRRACQSGRGWLLTLAVALGLTMAPQAVRAQFNGDFAIERHQLDDENFLDWKAYRSPQRWRYPGFTAPNRFQGSVGSISQSRFYLQNDIRLEAELGAYMTFLYMQEEESFYRSDPLYQEIELRVGHGIYGSVLGWVAADKRENQAGFALAYGKRTEWNFVRFTQLNQYFDYNEKNDQGARDPSEFERIPVMNRLELRQFWAERVLLDLTWIGESEAEFRDDGAAVTRRYEGAEIDVTLDWWLDGDVLVGLRYFRDEERLEQVPDAPSAALPDQRQRLLLEWVDVYGSLALGGGHQLTVGVLDGYFDNRVRSDIAAARFGSRLTTTLAYAQWEHAADDWAHGLFGLYSGEADERLRFGDDPAKSGNEDSIQLKGAAGLVLTEPGAYRFLFNSTWDLDLIEQRAWDGGNVQIQVYF